DANRAGDANRAEGSLVVLIHGLAQTAWAWAPVGRRLSATHRVVAPDLRGHGLSDSPTHGYDPVSLPADVLAVIDGAGERPAGTVLAGHGFGAVVAAWTAVALGERCRGLVLVDGGWEDVRTTTGLDPDEFLKVIAEPPEVFRSMAAYLADRAGFDPATWDADQERAARAAVVEVPAGKVVSSTRPHALAASVEALFQYEPEVVLGAVTAPIVALKAADDDEGTSTTSLGEVQAALAAAGRPPIAVTRFPGSGHNLMRYRPDEVTAAILALA
ncbi:MAG TPA: alpha/beta hydrolase, partial [Candidatus Acidoferrum sp.]|nr:alpha/beta hydrolase [Candidatus Acidoferrum sp.]